jgi:hypothetical protein
MFHEDGTMRKSCKSDLVKQFENEVSPVRSLPDFDPSLTTWVTLIEFDNEVTKKADECLLVVFDR